MYDDRYDRRTGVGTWIGGAVAVSILAVGGFILTRGSSSPQPWASALEAEQALAATPATEPAIGATDTSIDTSIAATVGAPLSTDTTTTTAPDATAPDPTQPTPAPSTVPEPSDPTDTTEPVPVVAAPAASVGPPAPPTTQARTATATLGYPSAPDGSPLPVIVTYDTGSVQLTGMVPSEESAERLVGLAQANSQDDAAEVTDNLIVNPDVPASVGVRVIELQSARFSEGRGRLTPEHITQIDRVASVMQALPHVSVLVIGHADQRGDDLQNLMLSEQRASTVVDYLVYLGVEPTRISMRGAGETDLLTLDDEASAHALNRRTEFIFYGVLV